MRPTFAIRKWEEGKDQLSHSVDFPRASQTGLSLQFLAWLSHSVVFSLYFSLCASQKRRK